MEMKIKMEQVVGLNSFLSAISSQKLPLKTTYKFSKLSRFVNDEMSFYNEKMKNLIEKYGQRRDDGSFIFSEDGSTVLLKKEELENCQKEINELNSIEVEVPNITFSVEELDFDISIREFELISPFVKE